MGYGCYDLNGRDAGYAVPAPCDYPGCNVEIDRGVSYVCGGEPRSGHGCDLFFCDGHRPYSRTYDGRRVYLCTRCYYHRPPYKPKSDLPEWIEWKLTDESWQQWRDENPEEVERLRAV